MSEAFWKHPRSSEALVRQWERKVSRWSSVPFLLEEVHQRMLSRAEIMRPVEGAVLVQGWMHAQTLHALKGRFSNRAIHLLHPATWPVAAQPVSPGVAESQGISSKFKSFLSKIVPNVGLTDSITDSPNGITAVEQFVATPGGDVPLPDASQALVWSPLWLHQINDPRHLMAEWHRVLKPNGGVFFSCFGPDTARELRGFAAAMGQQMPDFSDMHDLGDALSREGFSDPVMEMEKLTLTYADPRKMIAEWRDLNANLLLDRAPGLKGRAALAQAYAKLEEDLPKGADRHSLTLELVYGHAWKVQKTKGTQIATVQLSDIGGRKAK